MNQTDAFTTDPIHGLLRLARTTATIVISRLHQGVPLYDRMRILEIHDASILLQAQNSLILADLDGPVHLHSDLLPCPIQAQRIDQDLCQSLVLLGSLAYMPASWQERSQVRVQPGEPVYFQMQMHAHKLRANLLDLDINGIGACANHADLELLQSSDNPGIHIDLPLSPAASIRHLAGTLRYAYDLDHRAVRLGIHTDPTPDQLDLLSRYIEDRRARIVSELMDTYTHAISPAPVQSLYF